MMTINEITVTAENLEEAKEACRAVDQSMSLEVGASTWGITYEGGQRGQMTRWANGRGAVAFGGDSLWGDWVDGPTGSVLHVDSDPAERFDTCGERVED